MCGTLEEIDVIIVVVRLSCEGLLWSSTGLVVNDCW